MSTVSRPGEPRSTLSSEFFSISFNTHETQDEQRLIASGNQETEVRSVEYRRRS